MPITSWYSAFVRTGSVSQAFNTTTGGQTFCITGGTYKAYTVTTSNSPLFVSSGLVTSFVVTPQQSVFPITGANVNVFTTTMPEAPYKPLQLRIAEAAIDTNYTVATIVDGTGEYDAQTNPFGYNPPADPPDPTRPYRSDLKLWTVYRVLTGDNPTEIVFPTSQAEESDPDYEYPLSIDAPGVYEILVIAAPNAENYTDWQNQNLEEYAASDPNWYVVSRFYSFNGSIEQCLANKRWAFLQDVMIGNCDKNYFEFYALYVAYQNALEVQNPEYNNFYSELLKQCNEDECNCRC